MCLTIKSGIRESLLVLKVNKYLDKRGNKYVTPYLSARVPDDGVLRPSAYFTPSMISTSYFGVGSINGGLIHSYIQSRIPFTKDRYDAYALIPLYRGTARDIVSRALYIPDIDESSLKSKRLSFLKNMDKYTFDEAKDMLTQLFALEGEEITEEDWDEEEEDEDE